MTLLQDMVVQARRLPNVAGARRNFSSRLVRWSVELDTAGTFVRLAPLTAAGSETIGVRHTIPDPNRTSATSAGLGADTAEYLLGWTRVDRKTRSLLPAAKTAERHAAFRQVHSEWASTYPHDPVPRAIHSFFHSGQSVPQPSNGDGSQYVIISVGGVPAYESETAAAMWSSMVGLRKGARTTTGARIGLCLLCGRRGPLANTIPGAIGRRDLPGLGTKGAITSINEPAFGYDLTTGLVHAPICMDCAGDVTVGLSHVLAHQSIGLPGQDARFAWWTTDEHTDGETNTADAVNTALALLTEPADHSTPAPAATGEPTTRTAVESGNRGADRYVANAYDVARALSSIRAGRPPEPVDLRHVKGAAFGGNTSRVMVRYWLDMPLARMLGNIERWMADHRIGDAVYPLWMLVTACGRFDNDRKRYVPLAAKNALRPHGVERDLMRMALLGDPMNRAIVHHLLRRIVFDHRLDRPRAALLKLFLLREDHPSMSSTASPQPKLDPDCTDPMYLCGRLMVMFDSIQRASNNGQPPNCSFNERHLSIALRNPTRMLVEGLKMAQIAWLPRLRRQNPRIAPAVNRRLDDLVQLLRSTASIPEHPTLTQQATLLVAMHHERDAMFQRIRETKKNNAAALDPDPDLPDPDADITEIRALSVTGE
jgi:CRISPR-associated protein Csd1